MKITRDGNGQVIIENITLESDLATKPIVFAPEVLKPDAVRTFLASVGTEKNIPKAREYAKELVNLYEPTFLSYKLASYVGFYTRAELNLLYFNYLVRHCNEDSIDALEKTEDDEFWRVAFPNTDENQPKEYEAILPPLNGQPETMAKARAVRRERVLDLLILKLKLIKNEDVQSFLTEAMQFSDESGQNILANYDVIGIMEKVIDQVMHREDANDWLESPIFDLDWLKNQFAIIHERWNATRAST